VSVTQEYRALIEKVESFTRGVTGRRARDLTCTAGCSSCCHTWLSVSTVETAELERALAALGPSEREEVRARGLRELAREAAGGEPRCAMLDDQGLCVVYDARPLVCRTQGHALRYPAGFIPTEAVMRKAKNGDVTWCPLNYDRAEPSGDDVLDAERVDQILAVVVERHAKALDIPSDTRRALSALAAEGDVLHDRTAHDDEFENA
jgi:uncharacterized protein